MRRSLLAEKPPLQRPLHNPCQMSTSSICLSSLPPLLSALPRPSLLHTSYRTTLTFTVPYRISYHCTLPFSLTSNIVPRLLSLPAYLICRDLTCHSCNPPSFLPSHFPSSLNDHNPHSQTYIPGPLTWHYSLRRTSPEKNHIMHAINLLFEPSLFSLLANPATSGLLPWLTVPHSLSNLINSTDLLPVQPFPISPVHGRFSTF